MVRFLVRVGIALAASAIGLIVAAALLDGVSLDATSFLVAVLIYSVVYALMLPFLASQLRGRGASALGGVALLATLVALIVTDLVSDGLSIEGIGDWIAATLIVWLASLLAAFILPYLGLRKYLEAH